MKVRFNTSIAINHGGSVAAYAFGDEIEFSDDEAEKLLAAGVAERVDDSASIAAESPLETAVQPHLQEEQAVRRGRKGR